MGESVSPDLRIDEAVGNSKVFTSPADGNWLLRWAFVDNTSTATAGNRQLVLEILDPSSVVRMQAFAGIVQAASLNRLYTWGGGLPAMVAFVANGLTVPIPMNLAIPTGWKIRARDISNIAVLDTLKLYACVESLR